MAARSQIDLAPTIAELMGVPADPAWPGRSLVPEVFGETLEDRPIVVDLPRCDLMDRRRAVIDGEYKLLSFGDDSSFSLYKVTEDFAEEHELSETEPDRLEAMKSLYAQLSAKIHNEPVVGSAPLKGAPPGRRW